jgi:hypothetical protein
MSPIVVALLAFGLALVGILLGSVMQKMLPEGHLTSESKEVVKLSMGGSGDPGRPCAWAIGRKRQEYL